MKQKKYRITLSEEQLRLASQAIEDYHRFLSGQCELWHATSVIENNTDRQKCLKILREDVRPHIVPELAERQGAAYSWDGDNCPNKYQRKEIAMSYYIYREILHYFAVKNAKPDDWNTYLSDTLRCKEQGEVIKIEEAKEFTDIYVVTRCEEHEDYVEKSFFNKEDAEAYCRQFNDKEDEYRRHITKCDIE